MAVNSKTQAVKSPAIVAAEQLKKYHETSVKGYGGDALKVTRKEAEKLAKVAKLSPSAREALMTLAAQLDHARALTEGKKKAEAAPKVATPAPVVAQVTADEQKAKAAAEATAKKAEAEAKKAANVELNTKLLADFGSKKMLAVVQKVLAEGKGISACMTYVGGELDIIGLTSEIDRVPRLVLVNYEWASENVTVLAQAVNNPGGYNEMLRAGVTWLAKPVASEEANKPVAVNQEPEVKKNAPKKAATKKVASK